MRDRSLGRPLRAAAALVALLALAPARGEACGVELVLAMDVSRSITNAEFDLQVTGLSAAFQNGEVIDAIRGIPGGVMATVTQWSGAASQTQTVPWSRLTDAESSLRFAAAIDAQHREFFAAYTAIGEALWHAGQLSADNPVECERRVIDISGDGINNRGREPGPIARALAQLGFTVNALVILGSKRDLEAYFRTHVVRGPGAFMEVAESHDDYPRAIHQKLLRELRPMFSGLLGPVRR